MSIFANEVDKDAFKSTLAKLILAKESGSREEVLDVAWKVHATRTGVSCVRSSVKEIDSIYDELIVGDAAKNLIAQQAAAARGRAWWTAGAIAAVGAIAALGIRASVAAITRR